MSTIDERRERASAGVALNADHDGWYGDFARPRVFLQPIAAPSILGLAGFSVATFMVASIQAGWWGTLADFAVVGIFAGFFGGLAQFMAGMWSYRARDAIATLAHGTWGAFWMAFAVVQILTVTGQIPAPVPDETNLPFGLWFIGLAYITLTCALASIAEGIGLFAVLSTLATGAAFTAIGLLTGGFTSGWTHAGGWLFVFSAGFAWYTVTAMTLAAAVGRTVLPLGKWKRAANVPTQEPMRPIQLEWAEPGVKMGQ
jgi:succinate-acetate transporter protein